MQPDKKHMLESEGYEFDNLLLCYVNRREGKIYSSEWIEANNRNTIQISLLLPHNPSTWKLHLNPDEPHDQIKNGLYEKYGKTP